jgi:hypothetical protein
MTKISFKLEGGTAPKQIYVSAFGTQTAATLPGGQPLQIMANGSYRGQSLVIDTDGAFWSIFLDAAQVLSNATINMTFPALPTGHRLGWWHAIHNVCASTPSRGSGIRIGIIDEALAIQSPGSYIAHIHHDPHWQGSPTPPPTRPGRATQPRCTHGQAVCALLGSRPQHALGFEGIAPDAEIYFCSAGSEKFPQLPHAPPRLSKGALISCIDYLAQHQRCDLISVSAGDSVAPLPEIDAAVGAAADHGALCFFAAGNEGVVRYPAIYDGCLAVAALGQLGNAPADTLIHMLDTNAYNRLLDGSTYLWHKSAYGSGVDFCAPGIGVIWNSDGLAAATAFGTSFACPIATGAAAILLGRDAGYAQMPRDRSRSQRALVVISAACRRFGQLSEQSYWKYGRMWV